jgi:hypothetical protein
MRPRLLAAALAIVVPVIIGGCSAAGKSAAKDVTVTACTADPAGGHPVATGQIKNGSSKASTYIIHVRFVDSAGNGVGDGVATVGKVEAGGSATWRAVGTQSARGPLTCPLASVTRTATPQA